MRRLATASTPVCSVASTDDTVYTGTVTGAVQAWKITGEPIATHQGSLNEPVAQLQPLADAGLRLLSCGGVVAAHALDSLSHVVAVHRSRATRFDAHERAAASSLGVCSGHALVWCYSLVAPPAVSWKRALTQATRGLSLGERHAVILGASSCFVLCSARGVTLAELPLGGLASPVAQPSIAWRSSGRVVPLADGRLLLLGLATESTGASSYTLESTAICSPILGSMRCPRPLDGAHAGRVERCGRRQRSRAHRRRQLRRRRRVRARACARARRCAAACGGRIA
jgi:hypothetical protein